MKRFLAVVLVIASPALAEVRVPDAFTRPAPSYDPAAPLCIDDVVPPSPESPVEGVIAETLNGRLLRTCRDLGPVRQTDLGIDVNPARIPGLVLDYTPLTMVVSDGYGWSARLQGNLRSREKVGERVFGGTRYEVWAPRYDGVLYLRVPVFLYSLDLNPGQEPLPPHLIDCSGPRDDDPANPVTCFLHTTWGGFDVRIIFIAGGERYAPMPYDLLPTFVQDMHRVLDALDVTGHPPPGLPVVPVVPD